MSLVGTRPPTVDEWDKYELHHRARLATKPGLTGMWQVSGRSNITDFEEVVKLDKQYIRHLKKDSEYFILNEVSKVLSSKKYDVSFKILPKIKDTNLSLKYMVDNLAIVMQGPIRKEENFTYNTVKYYRHMYPNVKVIVSTWIDEDLEVLQIFVGHSY